MPNQVVFKTPLKAGIGMVAIVLVINTTLHTTKPDCTNAGNRVVAFDRTLIDERAMTDVTGMPIGAPASYSISLVQSVLDPDYVCRCFFFLNFHGGTTQ